MQSVRVTMRLQKSYLDTVLMWMQSNRTSDLLSTSPASEVISTWSNCLSDQMQILILRITKSIHPATIAQSMATQKSSNGSSEETLNSKKNIKTHVDWAIYLISTLDHRSRDQFLIRNWRSITIQPSKPLPQISPCTHLNHRSNLSRLRTTKLHSQLHKSIIIRLLRSSIRSTRIRRMNTTTLTSSSHRERSHRWQCRQHLPGWIQPGRVNYTQMRNPPQLRTRARRTRKQERSNANLSER